MQPGSLLVRGDIQRDLRQRQRMAQRDQFRGALCRHDAGDARGAEHVALLGIAGDDQLERRLAHDDAAFGHRDAFGRGLFRDVDHPRFAPGVDVGEGGGRSLEDFARHRQRVPVARAASPRQQRAGRRGDVGLPHQAFADQEGRHADARQPREIGGREDAAFADHQAIFRDQRRQRFAGRKRGLEGAQVAVVDADHRRTKFQRAIEFGAFMDFDQHVHAVARSRRPRCPWRRRRRAPP